MKQCYAFLWMVLDVNYVVEVISKTGIEFYRISYNGLSGYVIVLLFVFLGSNPLFYKEVNESKNGSANVLNLLKTKSVKNHIITLI